MPGVTRDADPDQELRRFLRAFPTLRVSVADGSSPFRIDYRSVESDRFAINRLRCSGRLRAVGPLPQTVAVGRRTSGTVTITGRGRAVDTSRPYLRPVVPSELEVHDGAATLITLQPASLGEYLERGGERGALIARTDTTPHLTALGLVMDHAATFLDRPDTLTAAVEEELHDLLCWSLLHAFEDPWAETGRTGARSSALRRAVQYMDQHAGDVVTMPAVAEAARISVRSLGMLFRRELDTTPLRWLQDLRLDRAHLDLLQGSGTVAEIAARHGMPHAGRFAAQYRARFAQPPASTLRGVPAGLPRRSGHAT